MTAVAARRNRHPRVASRCGRPGRNTVQSRSFAFCLIGGQDLASQNLARIGYHASHEQYAPSVLLSYVQTAERSGFDCAMSSEHFKPWNNAQGHAGHAWSWLGAALATTRLPFGIITAPGYRITPPSSRSRQRLVRDVPGAVVAGARQRAAPQ